MYSVILGFGLLHYIWKSYTTMQWNKSRTVNLIDSMKGQDEEKISTRIAITTTHRMKMTTEEGIMIIT